MALTNEDLQAIGALLKPMNDRLDKMDDRLDKMDGRLVKMDGRLDKMDGRLDKIESQVSALRYGQISLRKELKEVDIKVADTYQIALDAWGTSTENRKWLETKVPM